MKTALITGSSSGIGKAVAEYFLKKGMRVIGLARDHTKFTWEGDNFISISIDFSNGTDLSNLLKNILDQYPNVSTLVSNAGFGDFRALENFSVSQIQQFINVNLLSHIIVCRALISHMKSQGEGDIFLMGSEAALIGKRKSTLYSAAKFGLRGFAQSLKEEAGTSGVRVCLVNPGMVRSSFFEGLTFEPGEAFDNAIEPEDIAKIIFDLQSLRAGTIVEEVNLSPASKSIKFKTKI